MAAVGPTRQSRVSMSVSMSLVQGGAAGASAAGTVLGMSSSSFARYYHVSLNRVFIFSLSSQSKPAAAAAPYYQAPNIPQDVQPDRPIGYGAFGVVWWVSLFISSGSRVNLHCIVRQQRASRVACVWEKHFRQSIESRHENPSGYDAGNLLTSSNKA